MNVCRVGTHLVFWKLRLQLHHQFDQILNGQLQRPIKVYGAIHRLSRGGCVKALLLVTLRAIRALWIAAATRNELMIGNREIFRAAHGGEHSTWEVCLQL